MKINALFFVVVCLFFFTQCQNSNSKQIAEINSRIEKLEAEARSDLKGEELVGSYDELLSFLSPPDTLWDQTVWKKAQTMRYMGEEEKAIAELQLLYNKGSNQQIREDALFMSGFIEDEDLKNDIRAEMFYKQFLNEFPNSEKKEQVETLLRFIGKSNEEILNELQQKEEG